MSIRVIDAGFVPSLRSQSLYHGLAYARTETTPDTVLLVSPEAPYVSIGFHQELEKEVDVDFCKAAGMPIVRREVGGGAVYLDRNQLFSQWVMGSDSLPWRLERRFTLYAEPIVETYRALGIAATFRPVNDIHVRGRKIGGTGAAAIGQAEVMVGSLMFDFDRERMCQVLKVPSEKFRDKVHQSLREYMTTMKEELGEAPDREKVKEIYFRQCEKTLGRKVEPGGLTDVELKAIEALEAKLGSEAWLRQKGGLAPVAGVKIHQDVWVGESTLKAKGGLIRVTARLRGEHIEDVSISGDFTFHPHRKLAELERALVDSALEPEPLHQVLTDFCRRAEVQTPGVRIADWERALLSLRA